MSEAISRWWGFPSVLTMAAKYGQRLIKAFDRFHDVRSLNDHGVAKLLHELEIDIAVDLKGHTQDARLGILACRPSPIQVSYLGFPATMGADFIDYMIG